MGFNQFSGFARMTGCPLCKLKSVKNVRFSTRQWIILDCNKCKIPMIVWRGHDKELPIDTMKQADAICNMLFGDNWKWRNTEKSIPEHWHEHVHEE